MSLAMLYKHFRVTCKYSRLKALRKALHYWLPRV